MPRSWLGRPLTAGDEPPDPTVATIKAPITQCICTGWCRGRDSADWLTCSTACKHCNPPKRRRRGEHLRGEHDDG